jgi:hypothetical protein
VLGKENSRPAGLTCEPRLESDSLTAKAEDVFSSSLLRTYFDNPVVKSLGALGKCFAITALRRFFHAVCYFPQLGSFAVRNPFRCLSRAESLNGGPHLGDLSSFFSRHRSHSRSAILDPLYESIKCQFCQSGPNVSPAGPMFRGKV